MHSPQPAAFRNRTRLSAALAALLLLAGSTAAALAEEDIRALVIRSLRQGDDVPLTGQQVTAAGKGPARRQVIQAIKRRANGLRLEFLAPPGVRGQLLVDDGRLSRHYFPRFALVEEGESRLQRGQLQKNRLAIQLLKGRGEVREEGEDTVAGRPARVAVFTPLNGRARRLWIDRERAVVLKSEEAGAAGQMVSTYFTRVDYGAVPSASDFVFNPPPGVQIVPAGLGRPIPLARAQQAAAAWGGLFQPAELPRGYTYRAAFRTTFMKAPVVILVYSDGPHAFTLFQGPQNVEPRPQHRRNLNVAQRAADGVSLTAVGPLPVSELQRVVDSAAR